MQSNPHLLKFLTVVTGLSLLTSQPAAADLDTAVYNAPPPPDGIGAPTGRRDGGASRGNCPDYGDLTALVPITDGTVWGQTTSAQPTLWFYLPAAITAEQPMELALQNAADEMLYMTTVAADVDAGVIEIALPPTVTLPVGEPHYWTLALYCDPAQPTASVFVRGTIERAAEPLLAETAPTLSLAADYASAGIWYDALTVLGQLPAAERQALWTTLLEEAGLEAAAAAPIHPCCETP